MIFADIDLVLEEKMLSLFFFDLGTLYKICITALLLKQITRK